MSEPDSNTVKPGIRRLSLALALLGPLVVLGLAAAWFAQPPEQERSEAAQRFDELLEREQPEVIILGNSMALFGIDAESLGKKLGARVSNLAIAGSSASAWYLVLKNRAFGNDHRPHAVLVVGAARTLLANQAAPGMDTMNTNAHRGPVEPVVDAKLSGDSNLPIEWMWAKWRRDQLRSQILETIRREVVDRFFGAEMEAAEAVSTDSWTKAELKKVFGGEDALADVTAVRVIPVVDARVESTETTLQSVEDSFIQDFMELSDSHDTRIVFVRMPMAPSGSGHRADVGDAPYESMMRETLDWLSKQDAGFVDMRNIGLSDGDFHDYMHLNKEGRGKLTKALGEYLDEIGLMGNSPLPKVVNLAPGLPQRAGPLPTDPVLSLDRAMQKSADCLWTVPFDPFISLGSGPLTQRGLSGASPLVVRSGETTIAQVQQVKSVPRDQCGEKAFVGQQLLWLSASEEDTLPSDLSVGFSTEFPSSGVDGSPYHWLFPGQTISVEFPTAWPEAAGDFQVHYSAVQTAEGAPTQVSIDSGEPHLARVQGYRLELGITPEAPTGPWTLHLTAPADAAPTLVQSLSVGKDFVETWLIGEPNTLVTHRAVGTVRSTIAFDQPPPALDIPAPVPMENGNFKFDTPDLSTFDDIYSWRISGVWSCSPIRLTYDGEEVGRAHQKCEELQAKGPGSYCHQSKKVMFTPTEGTDPRSEPERWSLIVDPKRVCGTYARWLFPGETMTANPWRGDTSSMPAGIRSLTLQATLIEPAVVKNRSPGKGPKEPLLKMSLLHGETLVMTTVLRRDQLTGETVQFKVDPPLLPGKKRMFFVFEAPESRNYFVIQSAAVSEKELTSEAVSP